MWIRIGTDRGKGRDGQMKAGGSGLGEERLPPPPPIAGRDLVKGTKEGHGTIAITDHVGSTIFLHSMEVSTQLRLKLSCLYFHLTMLVIKNNLIK